MGVSLVWFLVGDLWILFIVIVVDNVDGEIINIEVDIIFIN